MQNFLIALFGFSLSAFAAQNCGTEPPVACIPDNCIRCYCLGPENTMVNAPVCPITCNGDISISVSGLYWKASQDGMEFAIDNAVKNNVQEAITGVSNTVDAYGNAVSSMTPMIDAQYLSPDFHYDFGFQLDLIYCSPCDGWDVGVYWTSLCSKASSHHEAEPEDNHTLFPLWSAFVSNPGGFSVNGSLLVPGGPVPFATDISSSWKLNLDLINLELGRKFWVSKYLSIRPHIGVQIAFLNQSLAIEHRGGAWEMFPSLNEGGTVFFSSVQPAFNNEVYLKNNFKGVGIRSGLDSSWHLGCGFFLYGELAASIVYGKFAIEHHELNREATSAHSKYKVLDTEDCFRASRAMFDIGLGVRWASMSCDSKYGIEIALGWEQHLFFHQNQLWRVLRALDEFNLATPQVSEPSNAYIGNNKGENTFYQRRGTLGVHGLTAQLKLTF